MVLIPVAALGLAIFAAYVLYQGRAPSKSTEDSDDELLEAESEGRCEPVRVDECNVSISESSASSGWLRPIFEEDSGEDSGEEEWEDLSRTPSVSCSESRDQSEPSKKHQSLRLNSSTSLTSVEFPDWTIHSNDLFGDQLEDSSDGCESSPDELDTEPLEAWKVNTLKVPEPVCRAQTPSNCGLSYGEIDFQLLSEDVSFLTSCLKKTAALKTPVTPFVPMV